MFMLCTPRRLRDEEGMPATVFVLDTYSGPLRAMFAYGASLQYNGQVVALGSRPSLLLMLGFMALVIRALLNREVVRHVLGCEGVGELGADTSCAD